MFGITPLYTVFLISSAIIFLLGRKKVLTTVERITLIVTGIGNAITFAILLSTGWTNAIIISGAIIVVVLVGIFWERIIGKDVKRKLGSPVLIRNKVQYYLSRNDLPLEEIISLAKEEIKFASVTHEPVSTYHWDTIRGAIIRSVKVTVMVLKPQSKHISKLENVFGIRPLCGRIENVLDELEKQQSELPADMRERLVLKTHDYDIEESMIVIDPSLQAEYTLIKTEEYSRFKTPTSRLNKLVFKSDHPTYYSDALLDYNKIESTAAEYKHP